ncbi:MAG: hypothetical protein GY696_25950 [Gammaproteobacteria bacterium]|nr:hypothetical protein [Gammaproteobacteria bacterium]
MEELIKTPARLKGIKIRKVLSTGNENQKDFLLRLQLADDSRKIIIYRIPTGKEPNLRKAIPDTANISQEIREELARAPARILNTNTDGKSKNWVVELPNPHYVRQILSLKSRNSTYKWDYSIHSRYRAQWKLCKTLKFFLINTQLIAVWYEIEDLTLNLTTRIGKTGPKTLLAEYRPNTSTQQVSENNEEEQTPVHS